MLLSRACRQALLAAITCAPLLAVASPADAAVTVVLYQGGLSSPGQPAVIDIAGGDGDDIVDVQRTAEDRIVLTASTGISRDGVDPDTAAACTDGGGGTRVSCAIPSGLGVTVGSIFSILGPGNDRVTVAPAVAGPEVRLDVKGGTGDDEFVGGAGDDAFQGGAGSDTYTGNGGGDFFADSGTDGIDTVRYDDAAHGASGVTVNMNDGNANDGAAGIDGTTGADQVAAGIDRVVGTDFDDTLFGSSANEKLVGGRGTDTLFGQDGDDLLDARDSAADSTISCGGGADTASVDAADPVTDGCETVDRAGATTTTPTPGTPGTPGSTLKLIDTTTTRAMPDLRVAPFKGASLEELQTELGRQIWAGVVAVPLTYAQAAARAGKAKVTPFDVIAQSPAAGARVTASAKAPLAVQVFYWDPSRDAVKQPCTPKARLRATSGGPVVSLTVALRGLSFREGKPGDEGEAQDLLRRVGCPYDVRLSTSVKAKVATVKVARAVTNLERKGKRVKGFVLGVLAPRNGNDFLTTFSEPLDLGDNELPLSERLRLPVRQNARVVLNTREVATGRVAEGTLVELVSPGGDTVAAGRTGTDGMVSLQAAIRERGTYVLYLSRDRRDPVTGERINQEGALELKTVTPGTVWRGVSGTVLRRRGKTYEPRAAPARAAAVAGLPAFLQIALDFGFAQTAGALADQIAVKAGLSKAERDALAGKLLTLFGVDETSPARALAGLKQVELVAAIGATQTGALCPEFTPPAVTTVKALAPSSGSLVEGTAEGARFGCGRAVLLDPTSGLIFVNQRNVLGGKLLANDGGSLLSTHGGGLIGLDGSTLIGNDGSPLVPVTQLIGNDGSTLIGNDGSTLQPVGGGTSFLSSGG